LTPKRLAVPAISAREIHFEFLRHQRQRNAGQERDEASMNLPAAASVQIRHCITVIDTERSRVPSGRTRVSSTNS